MAVLSMFWLALGVTGCLLAILGIFEIVVYFSAPYPAMKQVEEETGVEMPNRNLAIALLFGRPLVSVVVGIEALGASVYMLYLK